MKLIPILMSTLVLFNITGCIKEDLPVIEDIKKGSKWNLSIGDPFADVYKNVQEMGVEKDFSSVGLVYRKALSDPKELRGSLPYYHSLTVESNTGRVDRVIINLEDGFVTSLLAGGAMPNEVNQWPQRTVEGAIILKGDTIEELYDALERIHEMPAYTDYNYNLPNKPLDLPFDPGMKSYNEWAFTFFHDKNNSGKEGRSQVRLFFKDGKLTRIHHIYDEFDMVF